MNMPLTRAMALALLTTGSAVAQYPNASAPIGYQPAAQQATAAQYGATPRSQYPAARKSVRVAQAAPARLPSVNGAKPNMPQHAPIASSANKNYRVASQVGYGQPTPAAAWQPPASGPVPPPVPPQADTGDGSSTGDCNSGCGAGGGYPYGPMRRSALVRGWYVPFWHSPGDMPQHYPYFPNAHGYYYYRPYNVIHIPQQQEMINRWGLDPRNTMDNRFFERIYQEQENLQGQDTAGAPNVFVPR